MTHEDDLIAVREGGSAELWKSRTGATAAEIAKATHAVSVGAVYLATDSGERKVTGSYYTPHAVVMRIVHDTLGPAADAALRTAEASANRELSLLKLRIVDPSMGSGHFLVAATEYLAERLISEMERKYGPDSDPTGGEEIEAWAKRQVVAHCIYGVDLNPMAVELAKVSLWLTTFSRDRPLTFLDHRLRNGNSLAGARVAEIQRFPLDSTAAGKLTKGRSTERGAQADLTNFGMFVDVKKRTRD